MAAFEDAHDPLVHDLGPERAPAAIIERSLAWIRNHPEVAHQFCEHGAYIGFQRSLAYKCPRCPEQ